MSTPPKEESLNRRLVRLDEHIKKEYDLIGQRISWLLISNSFLFAAYVVAINNNSEKEINKSLVSFLNLAFPIIGMSSSILVYVAVMAAHNVVHELKILRDKAEDDASRLYGYERLGIHVKYWQHVVGNWPPNLLPPLLSITWAVLLYMRLNIYEAK